MPDAGLFPTAATASAEIAPAPGGAGASAGRYADMRESGIPWLGRVPAHWSIRRLKTNLARNDGGVWGDDFDPEGTIVLRSTEQTVGGDWKIDDPAMRALAASDRAAALLAEGDLVITKSSGSELHIGKTSIVTAEVAALGCCFSNFMQRLRCDRRTEPRFAYYILNSPIGREQMVHGSNTSTGLANLNGGVIGNILACWPPLPEQRAIAGWLDGRTRRIDELVAAKRRLIALLAEQRTASITHAVTKGLDPAAPMKPSGIDWLGEVPGHWEVKRLKFISHLQTGLTLGKKHTDEEQGRLVLRPYLRVANVQDGWLDLDHITEVEVLPERIVRYELRAGDVLMTEGGDFDKLGRGYVYEGQIDDCLHQNHIFAVRPDARKLDSRFLAAVLSCLHGRNYFTKTSQQTTNLASTNATKLGDFPVPLPPMAEQMQIMARVAEITANLDALTAAAEAAIARLGEYRQALISAAVTGKINVGGAGSAAGGGA